MVSEYRIYLHCRRHRRCGFDPWIRKILWRGKWHPTPLFFPKKYYGQRSLAGYSPWGCRVGRDRPHTVFTYIYVCVYVCVYIYVCVCVLCLFHYKILSTFHMLYLLVKFMKKYAIFSVLNAGLITYSQI